MINKRPFRGGVSRLLRSSSCERGFLLIEAVIAMVIFAIVCTAIVDMLVSSTSITTYAKQKTVAEEGVSNQIAYIRSLDYNSQIGLSGGNPAGIISASQTFNGVNGETLGVPATMTTDIEWASANVPGSAGTGADEKQVVVTITRNSDSKVLATATTYVAPKYQASQTSATVQATVTDIGNNTSPTSLEGVRVTLTPPSGLTPPIPAGPESDVTDSSGGVTFPGLTPTSGSQLYNVGIASADLPSLYYQIPVSGFALAPTQVAPESIQVYQPVTLNVALQQGASCPPTCSAFTGPATIKVTAGSGGTSWTFTHTFTAADYPGGWAITTQGPSSTTPLLPNIDYFIQVTATGYTSPAIDDALVPASAVSYPVTNASDLSNTFTETMVKLVPPAAEIDVLVQIKKKNSGSPGTMLTCKGATVKVTAGPTSANYTGTTASSSPFLAKFPNPADTNIVSNASPYDTTSYSIVATTTGGYTNSGSPTLLTGLTGTQQVTVNLGTTNSSTETTC